LNDWNVLNGCYFRKLPKSWGRLPSRRPPFFVTITVSPHWQIYSPSAETADVADENHILAHRHANFLDSGVRVMIGRRRRRRARAGEIGARAAARVRSSDQRSPPFVWWRSANLPTVRQGLRFSSTRLNTPSAL